MHPETRTHVTRVDASIGRRSSLLRPLAAIAGALLLVLVATAFVVAKQLTQPATYPSALLAAGQTLQGATAPGGLGYGFDVVQRQVEYPKAGSSLLPLVDPASPQIITGRVDHLFVNSVLARGRVQPEAFWMEMRFGPDETGTPVFEAAPSMFGVIAKGGTLWRNDGLGWYTTAVSPGVGMDPTTASLLPALLAHLTKISDLGSVALRGQPAHRYSGLVDVAYFPGVIASDGAAFTQTPISVDVWLDGSGRLLQLEGQANNLNEPDVDLRIDTVITFTYLPATQVPDPSPGLPSPASSAAPLGAP
jgi:hypothetical protein